MIENRNTGTLAAGRVLGVPRLGSLLVVVAALALATTVAFAHSDDESSSGRSIRSDANPSMDVALWYVPAQVNGALLASQALQRGANPGMDVALWYAPARANGALLASRALQQGTNPSMNVAMWYAPVQVSGALLASQALHPDANPSMNVALWYAPAESDFEALLCLAESVGTICQ